MFKELTPLIAERSLHLVVANAKDGKITLYVEPIKKSDDEADAYVTPLRLTASADELDAQLPDLLTEWVKAREQVTQPLRAALEASNKAMKEAADKAKKEAAEKAAKRNASTTKTVAGKPAAAGKTAVAPAPTLLDAPAAEIQPVAAAPAVTTEAPTAVASAPSAPDAAPAPAAISSESDEGATADLF